MIKDIAYQLIQEGVKLDSSLKSFELQIRYEGKIYTVKVVKDD